MRCPTGPNTLNVSNRPKPRPSLRGTSHIAICDASGNWDVVYYAAERKPYGTREDKKAGGDASSSACGYGGLKAGMRPPCKDRKVPVPRAKFSSDPRRP